MCSRWSSTRAMPHRRGSPAIRSSPWSRSTAGNPLRTVRWCADWAPACLPAPMTSILTSPLSTSPWKSVCGLTRLTTMTPSASARSRAAQTGAPNALSPTLTTSMVETTSAPTVAGVTPRPSSTARCPAAVAPPWLPMQGTMKGSPPALADGGDRGREHGRQVRDPSAAGRDRNAHPARHQSMQTDALQTLRDGSRRIHRLALRRELVHELQKRVFVPQTSLQIPPTVSRSSLPRPL